MLKRSAPSVSYDSCSNNRVKRPISGFSRAAAFPARGGAIRTKACGPPAQQASNIPERGAKRAREAPPRPGVSPSRLTVLAKMSSPSVSLSAPSPSAEDGGKGGGKCGPGEGEREPPAPPDAISAPPLPPATGETGSPRHYLKRGGGAKGRAELRDWA